MFSWDFAIYLLLLLNSLHVSAHPVILHPRTLTDDTDSSASTLRPSESQEALKTFNSTAHEHSLHTLHDLYVGNTEFRQNVRLEALETEDEAPSFMFLGCTDNRLSPSAIFNASAGSVLNYNNLGNQYSSKDPSADATIAYAVEEARVQHIIVLGHYGCKAVQSAITQSSKTSQLVKAWIKPISDLYAKTRRKEIVILRDSRLPQRGFPNGITAAPPASDAGYRALVEENIKKSVKELRKNSILTDAYEQIRQRRLARESDSLAEENEPRIFVHGWVYDEASGEVHDLHVSFGPPGDKIPTIPFAAIAAAENIQRDGYKPGINRGKQWDFHWHGHGKT